LRSSWAGAGPPYAILSHTWEQEEILLADIRDGTAESKKGYAKLIGCCKKAAEYGFDWVWIDTCCIDKTSSAELSEAINSMYDWYESSTTCFTYLQDVSVHSSELAVPLQEGAKHPIREFTKSRWFERGWTLQELLAPQSLEFYTFEWEEIGSKTSLSEKLASTTRIPKQILYGADVSTCNVAQRMSWASTRQTTWVEDIAYCLMGLFKVNMPLLYGEGQKAFYRLQEQIMKQEEDYTIFAWKSPDLQQGMLVGALASSPGDFSDISFSISTEHLTSNITRDASLPDRRFKNDLRHQDYSTLSNISFLDNDYYRDSFSTGPPEVTSRGLSITLPVMQLGNSDGPLIAWLYCVSGDFLICLSLEECSADRPDLMGRHANGALIGVTKEPVPSFDYSKQLFFCPNGFKWSRKHMRSQADVLQLVSFEHSRLRYSLRVEGGMADKDNDYHIRSSLGLQGDDWIRLRRAPMSIGPFTIDCASEEGSTNVIIVCYLSHQHRPWCYISEGSVVALQEEIDRQMVPERWPPSPYTTGLSDRCALLSKHIPNTVLSSVMRRLSDLGVQKNAYSVSIRAQRVEKA
jgi:hypothetical protein